MDSSQLPSYDRVKAYDRKKDEFINDETLKYSNCVEAALLGLVCCLVYDPNKKKYNTDHLPDNEETKPLKDFFKKYSEPRETTDYEMHEDWCRVIADLKNDKILYLEEKTNELDSSLLNILYVVSDITGSKEEVVKEIKCLEKLLSNKNINDKLDIEESLTTMFKELSNNKNLDVECDKFTVGTREDNNLDLFGEFKLVYTFNEKKNGILVEITSGHCALSLLEDLLSSEEDNIIKEKLTEIQNIYSNIESYTACTIRQYINIELAKMEKRSALGRIQESIRNNHDNINDIFLHGMIRSVEQKASIVKYFLIMNVKNTLPKNNSLVRFTNNLIGSTPLDDFETREDMLCYCGLNKDSKSYYKGIESYLKNLTKLSVFNFNTIINDILDKSNYSLGVKLECFKKLMMVVADDDEKYAIVTESFSIKNIILFSMETDEPAKTVLEFIKIIYETVMQPDGSNGFVAYLKFIYHIATSNEFNLDDKKEVIKTVMDKIDVNYNLNLNNKWDSCILNHFHILEYLQFCEDILCDKKNPNSVKNCNSLIETIKKTIEVCKRGSSR
ncbi:hypothetical protein NEQG_01558 [Nematocida parisii ERTm3]|uniref:Uncharacterized protein n=1 Tax=Nematocida parisii (strain ERTm3) TaxID=935791 RepID=I3EFW7_NEMP3|nr:hypothetical protein NEQG_01558 [Nematocida parisii ERTm3]